MSDNEVSAREMVHSWRSLGIIHGVRHITHQSHVFANLDHLPDPKWPPQNAHVEMHSAQDDIIYLSRRKKIVGLLAVIRNGCLLYTSPSPRDS